MAGSFQHPFRCRSSPGTESNQTAQKAIKPPRLCFLLGQGGNPPLLHRQRFGGSISPASNLCPATKWCPCVWRRESLLCPGDRQLRAALWKSTCSRGTTGLTVELVACGARALFVKGKPPSRGTPSYSETSIRTVVLAEMKYEIKKRKNLRAFQ